MDSKEAWQKIATSLIIRELQIKTTMRYHLTLIRMAFIKKSINNKFWEGVEKKEPSYIIGENVNRKSHSREQYQFSSVAQSCPTLCGPMNRSTPGLPVHHQLPEFTQTHVHQVGDAISSSVVPFSSCPQSLPASGSFLMSQLFAWRGLSIGVSASASVLPKNTQDWSLVGSPCSPRDSQESSPKPQFKSVSFLVLSFLHSPTLTSIHDHRKNHSLD